MIRASLLNSIRATLAQHTHFNVHDFQISTSDGRNGTTLTITSEYDSKFSIDISIPDSKSIFKDTEQYLGTTRSIEVRDYKITGKMKPGTLTLVESIDERGEAIVSSLVYKWLENLWEEIASAERSRQFDDLKVVIDELKKSANDIEEVPFTREEIEEMKERLKKVEEQVAQHIKKSEPDEKIAKKQTDELRGEVRTLENTLPRINKRAWMKTMIARMAKFMGDKDNRTILEAGKKLIASWLQHDNFLA